MSGWINPISFGAVGDGIAYDDAAFNSAVATIGSSGTILLEPGKNFRLGNDVVIPPSVSVQFMGLGPETSRVTVSGAINGFRQSNTAGLPLTKGIGFSNFKIVGQGAISGIKLVGAGAPGADSRVQRIQINHMSISGFSAEAIRLEKATNFLLTDMFLFNNGNAIRTLNAGDGKITGVKTGSNSAAAFLIEGGAGGAWDEGVNLHGNQLNGDHKGVVFKNMFYCWLVSTQVGSTTAGAVIIDNTDNCIISASEISNALGNADGIVMLNSPQRASIVGNFINGCKNYGAVLRGSGHVFASNILTGGGANVGRDIHLDNCTKSIVSGNSCLSTPAVAYSIEEAGGSDKNVFASNILAKTLRMTGASSVASANIENA